MRFLYQKFKAYSYVCPHWFNAPASSNLSCQCGGRKVDGEMLQSYLFFFFLFFELLSWAKKRGPLLPHGTPPPLLFTQMLPRVWLISWEKKTTIFLLGGGWVRERCEEESEIKSCVTKLGMRTRAYDKNLAVTTDLWKDWGENNKEAGYCGSGSCRLWKFATQQKGLEGTVERDNATGVGSLSLSTWSVLNSKSSIWWWLWWQVPVQKCKMTNMVEH